MHLCRAQSSARRRYRWRSSKEGGQVRGTQAGLLVNKTRSKSKSKKRSNVVLLVNRKGESRTWFIMLN